MNPPTPIHPTRMPGLTPARSGGPRHYFPAVMPRVRASFALRRLELSHPTVPPAGVLPGPARNHDHARHAA